MEILNKDCSSWICNLYILYNRAKISGQLNLLLLNPGHLPQHSPQPFSQYHVIINVCFHALVHKLQVQGEKQFKYKDSIDGKG